MSRSAVLAVRDASQFHIWAVEWTPDGILTLLDGKQVDHVVEKAMIPTTPHQFVAQTDMGSSWAGKPTSQDTARIELVLDYVKQWRFIG